MVCEALAILQREHVDLVLLDLMMPEMDGFAVLEAMRDREATRDIPVIVVTGVTLTEAEMARLNLGVAKVLEQGPLQPGRNAGTPRRRAGAQTGAERRGAAPGTAGDGLYARALCRGGLAAKTWREHVGLSDDYLTSCFHKELGLTPVAYLNRYRIQQARQLLKNTHMSITEIALDVGFSGSSYFSRIFRRETGVTPEAYRRS